MMVVTVIQTLTRILVLMMGKREPKKPRTERRKRNTEGRKTKKRKLKKSLLTPAIRVQEERCQKIPALSTQRLQIPWIS